MRQRVGRNTNSASAGIAATKPSTASGDRYRRHHPVVVPARRQFVDQVALDRDKDDARLHLVDHKRAPARGTQQLGLERAGRGDDTEVSAGA